MGKEFMYYIETKNVYKCKDCGTHFSSKNQVVSKNFTGRYGRSFLVNKIINYNEGQNEERILLTGIHVIRDIYCKFCKAYIGWFYLKAYEQTEKYKEGKFILERNQVLKVEWEN